MKTFAVGYDALPNEGGHIVLPPWFDPREGEPIRFGGGVIYPVPCIHPQGSQDELPDSRAWHAILDAVVLFLNPSPHRVTYETQDVFRANTRKNGVPVIVVMPPRRTDTVLPMNVCIEVSSSLYYVTSWDEAEQKIIDILAKA